MTLSHRIARPLGVGLALGVALALAAPATAQNYTLDNGTTENALSPSNVVETGFLHGFDAGAGDGIVSISVAIGTALAPAGGLDGRSTRLCVWDDPTDDGDPVDAVLLYESAPFPATQTNSDQKVLFNLPSTVSVSGRFFVGVIVETQPGDFPVGLDIDGFTPGADAYFFGDATAVDAAQLAASSVSPSRSTNAVFLLDAMGGGNSGLGTNYCMTNPNSSGLTSTIRATGSNQIALNNVTLIAEQLPVQQFGIFITSRTQGFVVNANGTSNGNLCLGGQIGRFRGPGQILNSGGAGSFELTIDLTAIPEGAGTVAVMMGETRNFQAWHRDGVGLGSNFTDALEISFQ